MARTQRMGALAVAVLALTAIGCAERVAAPVGPSSSAPEPVLQTARPAPTMDAVFAPTIHMADHAALTGEFTSWVRDDTGDGLLDALIVAVGIDVREAGHYSLSAVLADAEGAHVASTMAETALPVGPAVVDIVFDGVAIRRGDTAGPYVVSTVDLFLTTEDGTAIARQHMVDAHVTEAYEARAFAAPPLELTGRLADRLLDRDGDGAGDAVAVEVEVIAAEAGEYYLTASLSSSAYRHFAAAETERVTLEPGAHTLVLVFEGVVFRGYQVDGPYELGMLRALRARDSKWEVIDTWSVPYETEAYRAADFAPRTGE